MYVRVALLCCVVLLLCAVFVLLLCAVCCCVVVLLLLLCSALFISIGYRLAFCPFVKLSAVVGCRLSVSVVKMRHRSYRFITTEEIDNKIKLSEISYWYAFPIFLCFLLLVRTRYEVFFRTSATFSPCCGPTSSII